MRSSVIGSTLVHIAAVALIFAVKTSAPLIIPGPSVVQVALVNAPITQPVQMPAPQPRRQEEPLVTPTEDTGVKLSEPKPKPKPKAEEEKREEPPVRSDVPVPALPSARVGSAGLSGSISLDAADFEFTYYLLLVRNRIAQNWSPPSGLATGGQPVRAVVYFKIARDGRVSGVKLEDRSGREYFDRSTLRAVVLSDPLPPLPAAFNGTDLGVHFGFEYGGP